MLSPLCDDDCECPDVAPERPLRDVAKLVAAAAPIVVTLVKFGPSLLEYVRGLVATKPPPERKPTAAPRRKPKPRGRA